jgi:hypothetical protein
MELARKLRAIAITLISECKSIDARADGESLLDWMSDFYGRVTKGVEITWTEKQHNYLLDGLSIEIEGMCAVAEEVCRLQGSMVVVEN